MFERQLKITTSVGNSMSSCSLPGHFRSCFSVLVILVIFSLIPHSAHATVVRLRSEVAAETTLISLGDIAEILETDEATAVKLKKITIAPAPAAGRPLKITIERIRRELTLRGVDQTGILFIGPSESLVTHGHVESKSTNKTKPQTREIKNVQNLLSTSIKNYVLYHAPELGSVQIVIPAEQMQVLASQFQLVRSVQVQGGQLPWTGVQKFQISFSDSQGAIRNIPLICEVNIKQRALALKMGLPRGKVIHEDDLVFIELDDTSNTDRYFSKMEDLVGTETKRNILAQRPVRPDDVRQIPLVKRGDIVSVYARVGSVNVMRYCTSLGDGTKGQLITLTPIDSKEKLTARVIGYHQAEIPSDTIRQPAPVNLPLQSQPVQTMNQTGNRRPRQFSNQGSQPLRLQTPLHNQQYRTPNNPQYTTSRVVPTANVSQTIRSSNASGRVLSNGRNGQQLRARTLSNRPVQLQQR